MISVDHVTTVMVIKKTIPTRTAFLGIRPVSYIEGILDKEIVKQLGVTRVNCIYPKPLREKTIEKSHHKDLKQVR